MVCDIYKRFYLFQLDEIIVTYFVLVLKMIYTTKTPPTNIAAANTTRAIWDAVNEESFDVGKATSSIINNACIPSMCCKTSLNVKWKNNVKWQEFGHHNNRLYLSIFLAGHRGCDRIVVPMHIILSFQLHPLVRCTGYNLHAAGCCILRLSPL